MPVTKQTTLADREGKRSPLAFEGVNKGIGHAGKASDRQNGEREMPRCLCRYAAVMIIIKHNTILAGSSYMHH